jgi:hypothetical protein
MTVYATRLAFFVKLCARVLGIVLTGTLFLDLIFISLHL